MAAPQYDWRHRQQRAELIRSGYWIGQPCPRCLRPMWPGQRLDLGHVIDVAAGGFAGPKRLEHSSCNRKAGQAVAAQVKKNKLAKTRSPAEQAASDHRLAVRQRREARLAFAALEQQEHPGRPW